VRVFPKLFNGAPRHRL